MYYLNEYITNRKYGGPEEGGWWYDVGRFVKCHGTHDERDDAKRALDELRKTYLNEAQKGLLKPGNVGCSGYPDIFIQEYPGRNYPVEMPVYR